METESITKTLLVDGKTLTFTKVKAKTAVGKRHVYDFEVKDVHNYFANGVNVHNCEYHAMLDDYGKRLGVEFFRKKDIYLKYMHKNLELYPAGPSKRALRGRTRWLAGTDELGWWPIADEGNKDRERADGEEVYKALDRSLLTMRREIRTLFKKGYSNFLMPLNINVSSPSDQADMINRLVEKNKGSTRCLALRLPTWEVTPLFGRDNEEIVQAYKDDPVAAERDYGANPPLNSKKFIEKETACRVFSGQNRVKVTLERGLVNDKWRRAGKLEECNPPQPCPASLLSIDAGFSNNSFAGTVLYLDKIKIGDSVKITVRVPAIFEIQPAPGETLHYTRIYKNVLKKIIESFNVRYLFADRWNSIALLDQAAEDFSKVELVAAQYSVKYKDFVLARSYIEESKIVLPKINMDLDKITLIDEYPSYFADDPAAHLLFQMMTVKDVGSTVVKGGNYTDDIFRALVLGISRVLDPKISDRLLELSAKVTRQKLVGAVTAGRSMGIQGMLGFGRPRPTATSLIGYSGASASVPNSVETSLDTPNNNNVFAIRVSRN